MTKTPFLSWLRASLRENGATRSQISRLTSPFGIANFLKREPSGRYGIGNITISDYAARAIRKEILPSIERKVASEAAKTGRSISEILASSIKSRRKVAVLTRELSPHTVTIGGKAFTLRPHTGKRAFEHFFQTSKGERESALFAGDDLLRMQEYREALFAVRRTGGRDKAANERLRSFAKMEIRDIEGKRVDLLTDPQEVVQQWSAKSRAEKNAATREAFYSSRGRRGRRSSVQKAETKSRQGTRAMARTSRGH